MTGIMMIGIINLACGQCSPPTATSEFSLAGYSVDFANDGSMFSNYEIPNFSGKKSWYSSSIWISALTQNGSLMTAGHLYGTGNDFYPGQLDANGEVDNATCNSSDRIFKLDRIMVDLFRTHYDEAGFVIPLDILEWPAAGNPNAEFDGGAPFVDVDGDLTYDAENGDYPAFSFDGSVDMDHDLLGDQCIWYVINDAGNLHFQTGGDQLQVQIQCMAYSFYSCDELENQSFYRYTMTNKGSQDLLETSIGFFADPDIGESSDDYIQCDVARNMGFGYNGDVFDGVDGTGPGEYSGNPPAAGLDVLKGPLADANDGIDNDMDGAIDEVGERIGMWRFASIGSFGAAPPYGTQPSSASEYHQYLNGFWKDGAPIGYGGGGHPNSGSVADARYMYPSDTDPLGYGTNLVPMTEWSEETSNNAPGDRKLLLTIGNFTLVQSESKSIHLGALWAKDVGVQATNASIEALKQVSDSVQVEFDALFPGNNCCPLDAIFYQVDQSGTVSIFSPVSEATTYFWDFGDGTTSTDQFPVHDFITPGNFEVCLTQTNDCDTAVHCETIVILSSGINDQQKQDDLEIYPNPSNGNFTVSHPGLRSIQIHSVDGRSVYSESDLSGVGNIELNEAPGIYFIVASTDKESLVKKLILR